MYYDPDYYHYDKEAKTYTLHSRVQLPDHRLRKRKKEEEVEIVLIDDDEFTGKKVYLIASLASLHIYIIVDPLPPHRTRYEHFSGRY